MKRFITTVFACITLFSATLAVIPVQTANAAPCNDQSFLLPKWYDDLCEGNEIMSPNDGCGNDAQTTGNCIGGWVAKIAINLVTILLTIVGYVSLGYVIYGGFKYMTSGDNSGGTQAARKTITNALIGLVLSILSVAIVNFVTRDL